MRHDTRTAGGGRHIWRWAATLALLITLLGGAFAPGASAAKPPQDGKHPAPPQGSHAPRPSGAAAAAVTPGNLYGWGYNDYGQVGDGTDQYDYHYIPVQTVGIGNVVSVASGYYHTIAATADGTVYTWGYDGYAALGIGLGSNSTSYDYPMQVVAPGACPAASPAPNVSAPAACGYLTGVVAVAVGYYHSVALTKDGTVYAWGYNESGQVGTGAVDSVYYDRPVQIVGPGGGGFLTDIKAIAASEYNTYFLKNDGTVWSLGYDGDGQLGNNGATPSGTGSPVQVVGPGGVGFLTDIKAISASDYGEHVLALTNTGTVYAWGYNSYGELGDNTTDDRYVPVPVAGPGSTGILTDVKGIGAGAYHSLAVRTDGTVWAWGYNGYGELGDGTFDDRHTPVQVKGPGGVGVLGGIAQVSGGYDFSLALTTDGRVLGWGEDDYGFLGAGTGLRYNPYPIPTRNANGPGQLSGISVVVAGSYNSFAIASATATPSATSLAFGDQTLNTTSAAKSVTITNGGGGPLTITGATITGANPADFAQNGGCAGTLAPGGSCTVGVTFTPAATGARAATLSVATNAGQVDVALTGTGVAVPGISYTVTASASGTGTVTPAGTTTYPTGTVASYSAVAAAGQTFTGWTLDGQYVGYASPLNFTVNSNRTLVATFVATPTFSDLGQVGATDRQMITFLAARGIINPAGVNGSGQFQPFGDVARAEVAAFIARAFGWENEFHANNFPDRCEPGNTANCIDAKLWNDVAALKDYGVVGGYTDAATCAAGGTTAPCYLPRDGVQRVQVVSIVARAFIKTPDLRPTGFWDRLAAVAGQYTNVSTEGTQRSDLTTYRANAGEIPGQSDSSTFANPTGNANRLFVIQVLYQAYNAQFGVDRVP